MTDQESIDHLISNKDTLAKNAVNTLVYINHQISIYEKHGWNNTDRRIFNWFHFMKTKLEEDIKDLDKIFYNNDINFRKPILSTPRTSSDEKSINGVDLLGQPTESKKE